MATCISITNLYSNTVATFFIARWEGAFDQAQFDAYFASEHTPSAAAAEIAHLNPSPIERPQIENDHA
jgi:hypothetical protein